MKKLILKIKSEKGAIDKVIVTLLLIIVAVAGIVGLEQWTSNQKTLMQTTASTTASKIIKK